MSISRLGRYQEIGKRVPELVGSGGDVKAPAMYLGALARALAALAHGGAYREADSFVGELRRVGEPLAPKDPAVRAALSIALGVLATARGDSVEAIGALRTTLEAYAETGDRRGACVARLNLGYHYVELGSFEQAETVLRENVRNASALKLGG